MMSPVISAPRCRTVRLDVGDECTPLLDRRPAELLLPIAIPRDRVAQTNATGDGEHRERKRQPAKSQGGSHAASLQPDACQLQERDNRFGRFGASGKIAAMRGALNVLLGFAIAGMQGSGPSYSARRNGDVVQLMDSRMQTTVSILPPSATSPSR
jgi:hypothetical protein